MVFPKFADSGNNSTRFCGYLTRTVANYINQYLYSFSATLIGS